MANDGQIVFEVTADGKHAIADIKEITKAIQQESGKWDKAADQSANNINDSFSGMLKKLVAGFSAVKIGQALLDMGKDAIEAASNLQEVQNVVDTTFGDNASKIEQWAKSAGEQFGLTELQAKKFSSTMGAMLKSSGLAGEQIVEMSTDLSGLAADMASFYNLDFDEAFQKIRSGISGETEPLKQLGINMSVANLNAFALQKGLEKTFDQMSQGEQVMLRYQYMMSATADAQGDFAKTADGFANSQRRIQAALDTISTIAGGFLLNAISPLVSGVADLLSKLTATPERTIFDDFNDIEIDTADKMTALDETYNKASSIIELLKEISEQTVTLGDGSTLSFEDLFKQLGEVEKSGGDVGQYIESLGLNVDEITQKYNVWKEATRQLTSLVPELTDVIDEETGAIDGGTDALQKNLDEWKANEEKKLAWAAYYAKARALEERKAQLYMAELEAGIARKRAEQAREAIENVWNGIRLDEEGNVLNATDYMGTPEWNKLKADMEHYYILLDEQQQKEEAFAQETKDLEEAELSVADALAVTTENYGEQANAIETVTDVAEDYKGKSVDAWKTVTTSAQEALKSLADYANGIRDSVTQAVDSTFKQFNRIESIAEKTGKVRQKISDLAAEQAKYEIDSSDWRKLQREIDDLNAQITSREGMYKGLESQGEFLDQYLENLEKAQKMGLSSELLASLSDGTYESAEYLNALVNDTTGRTASEIDAKYKEIQQKKEQLTAVLTDQQLTASQVYQNMLEEAKKAVDGLDLSTEAGENGGKTIEALADGIKQNVPEVASAVDAVLAELSRLSGLGINIGGIPVFGSSGRPGSANIGEYETGLDRVPFDGFLASLHEGEGILTAEENRIWQRFKNGTGGIDYDVMGGVLRDNVKPGGNVYLDGRVVGSVISDQQGQSYRRLQRSGWQG